MPVRAFQTQWRSILGYLLVSRTKSYLEPGHLVFAGDGLRVSQTSPDRLLYIHALFTPRLFEEYEPMGEAFLDLRDLYAVLGDYFTGCSVELALDRDRGEALLSCETASYRTSLLAPVEDQPSLAFREIEGALLPDFEGKAEYTHVYEADLTPLRRLKKTIERVRLHLGEALEYEIQLPGGSLRQRLTARPVRAGEPRTVTLPVDIVQAIAKAAPVRVTAAFAFTVDGEPAPAAFAISTENFSVTYVVAPLYD